MERPLIDKREIKKNNNKIPLTSITQFHCLVKGECSLPIPHGVRFCPPLIGSAPWTLFSSHDLASSNTAPDPVITMAPGQVPPRLRPGYDLLASFNIPFNRR